MDSMSAEQVIENIRACVVSCKGGVSLKDINRDYKMIVGNPIPYQNLGYQSLESFLRSLPDLNLRPVGGDLLIEAAPTKNTYHITQMVRGQKSSSSRRKGVPSRPAPRHSRLTGKQSLNARYPPRRVQFMEKPKPPAGFQSTPPLASLSKANTPPRLKTFNQPMPNQKIISARDMSGPRRGKSSYSPEQPFYQDDITSSLHQPTSPVDLLNPASSVLRTPTAVLGPTSPSFEFRMPSNDAQVSSFPPPLILSQNYAHMPRTNAQARISRHATLPPPIDRDGDVKLGPVFDYNPYIRMGVENQSNQKINSPSSSKAEETVQHPVLDSYCRAKHLPDPYYKIINNFPKSKTKQIVCSIKVGPDHGFSSYPSECKTVGEAVEVAAQAAIDSLKKIHGELGESLPITTNENLLIARIAEMLDEHPNGLWSLQVPADYRALHHEILPDGWLDILRGSPLITIDRAVHNRIILLPNRAGSAKGFSAPELSSQTIILDLNSKMEGMAVKEENKVDQRSDGAVTSLGTIRLPEDVFWNVYVSYATSTTNIWIRLIGEEYSTLYDDMAADMELLYMDGGTVVENLVVGHFYAIQVDDCWHRVELIELSDDSGSGEKTTKLATCFFVDNGDDEILDASQLRKLDYCFTKLACQAVQCHLTGLDDFSSDIVESHLVSSIIGRNLVAKPTAESLEDDGSGRPYPSLTLYDTSTDDNINLNDVLLEKILKDAVPPILQKNGKIQEAFVSYVAQTGSLFVQLPSNVFDYIMKAVEEYSSNIAVDSDDTLGKVLSGVRTVFPDVVYLAKYKEDMLWYRAVKDMSYSGIEDGKVWVKFVDFGNSELISFNDLVTLPSSSMLCKLPFQAIGCRLNNMAEDTHFTEKGLRRCREIVPSEDPVLLKVVSSMSDPNTDKTMYDVVEIFKRVLPDNLLASVSTTLSVEEGVFEKVVKDASGGGDGNNELRMNRSVKPSKVSQRTSLPNETGNLRTLSAPKVPKVGDLFDVHVTIAANPGNFTVQPWKDATKFSEMMSAMQSVYSTSSENRTGGGHLPEEIEKCRRPLKKSDINEGGVYAALHEDQMWYRINVSKLIDAPYPEGGMVSAYFVDYGDVAVMTLDKLRQLSPQFFDVPYQAIKAKLAGVSPVHSDWSVEDCLRFQEMVCNKQFVATIVEMGPDLIDPSDTVIGIHLTDTSDPKVDQSIGQIFIDEGRAVAC